jgi:hypothetical protein
VKKVDDQASAAETLPAPEIAFSQDRRWILGEAGLTKNKKEAKESLSDCKTRSRKLSGACHALIALLFIMF